MTMRRHRLMRRLPRNLPTEEAWAPADGWQRTLYTTLASIVAGAGFAALLAGISLLIGVPITPANGLLWGLCGFLAASGTCRRASAGTAGNAGRRSLGRQIWWVGDHRRHRRRASSCRLTRRSLGHGRRGGAHRPAPYHRRARSRRPMKAACPPALPPAFAANTHGRRGGLLVPHRRLPRPRAGRFVKDG